MQPARAGLMHARSATPAERCCSRSKESSESQCTGRFLCARLGAAAARTRTPEWQSKGSCRTCGLKISERRPRSIKDGLADLRGEVVVNAERSWHLCCNSVIKGEMHRSKQSPPARQAHREVLLCRLAPV